MLVFHLKKLWIDSSDPNLPVVDLYEEIKSGRKTSKWRNMTPYWSNRLWSAFFGRRTKGSTSRFVLGDKERIAFIVGYPRGNLPRLEADIVNIVPHCEMDQFEIKFKNVVEVS